MFRSIQFSIENRLGIEDQRVESFLGELNRLGALEIQPTYGNKSDNLEKRNKLAQFLSDYHLITFLSETQLLSSVSFSFVNLTCLFLLTFPFFLR